ncbi:MAG: rhaM [Verrucomicrobiales bacterium]|nr:rhaM [Verrucomicrobiales bacterium]
MIRKSFVMAVNAGAEKEYIRRHQPIWPELEATLISHGVKCYSISLLPETGQLFAYVEFRDEAEWKAIAETDVCRRWWSYMSELMPTNADQSPVARELTEIFHIESKA